MHTKERHDIYKHLQFWICRKRLKSSDNCLVMFTVKRRPRFSGKVLINDLRVWFDFQSPDFWKQLVLMWWFIFSICLKCIVTIFPFTYRIPLITMNIQHSYCSYQQLVQVAFLIFIVVMISVRSSGRPCMIRAWRECPMVLCTIEGDAPFIWSLLLLMCESLGKIYYPLLSEFWDSLNLYVDSALLLTFDFIHRPFVCPVGHHGGGWLA